MSCIAAGAPGLCDSCDRVPAVLFSSLERGSDGDWIIWKHCAECETKRLADTQTERALVESFRPNIQEIIEDLHTMDRHALYKALQRLSLEVITA